MKSLKFAGPAEAFAAVATMIIACDKLGTGAEKDFLFDQVKSLPVFERYDRDSFATLMADMVDRICQTMPKGQVTFTTEGIEKLVQAVKAVLSPELCEEVYEMAV